MLLRSVLIWVFVLLSANAAATAEGGLLHHFMAEGWVRTAVIVGLLVFSGLAYSVAVDQNFIGTTTVVWPIVLAAVWSVVNYITVTCSYTVFKGVPLISTPKSAVLLTGVSLCLIGLAALLPLYMAEVGID